MNKGSTDRLSPYNYIVSFVSTQAKKKGELKGKTERTKEDKLRERKQKKAAKREKMKEKEKRRKEVEKMNPGLGNKYSKERALKDLEKHASGNIEVVKVGVIIYISDFEQ